MTAPGECCGEPQCDFDSTSGENSGTGTEGTGTLVATNTETG